MFVRSQYVLPTSTPGLAGLSAYVKYNSNPQGPQYQWPEDRLAIWQAQQKKAKEAAASKGLGRISTPRFSARSSNFRLRGLGDVTCTIDPVTGGRVCSSPSTSTTPAPNPGPGNCPPCNCTPGPGTCPPGATWVPFPSGIGASGGFCRPNEPPPPIVNPIQLGPPIPAPRTPVTSVSSIIANGSPATTTVPLPAVVARMLSATRAVAGDRFYSLSGLGDGLIDLMAADGSMKLPDGSIIKPDGTTILPGQNGKPGSIIKLQPNTGTGITAVSAADSSGAMNPVLKYGLWITAGLVGAAILVPIVKSMFGRPSVGRAIPGAHVYEKL